MQSGQVPGRAILIGGFTGLRRDGQQDLPDGLLPKHVDNTKVSSQQGPGQGGAGETVKAAPEGQTLVAGHMGEKDPMDTDGGGYLEFGPQPDTAPETNTVLETGRQPP